MTLRLKTLSPLQLSLSSTQPLILPELTQLRTLLNQTLDCIDITRWTGDRTSADFIDGQLRLLHGILLEALGVLRGPPLLSPPRTTHIRNPRSNIPYTPTASNLKPLPALLDRQPPRSPDLRSSPTRRPQPRFPPLRVRARAHGARSGGCAEGAESG